MFEASRNTQRVGEVVEAATQGFTAQCYQLYHAPPLGTLVKAGVPDIYGAVGRISTESLYPGRPVVARGAEEETEGAVYAANPQLERLLCTRFEALVLGHRRDGGLQHGLPPLPPRVHAFVHRCTQSEVAEFTQEVDFLRLLLSNSATWADEIVIACLVQAAPAHDPPRDFLVKAGKALASELASDLPRLNAILRRISP